MPNVLRASIPLGEDQQSWIREAVSTLPKRPTIVVGLGHAAAAMAKAVSALCGVPFSISVDSPVRLPGSHQTIGVVSGTDDMAFLDQTVVKNLHLRLDEIQALAQAARLDAIRQAHELAGKGLRPVPQTLEKDVVLCVTCADERAPCSYQLQLLKCRHPESLVVLSSSPTTCKSLRAQGLVENAITFSNAIAHEV